jgi:choline dehydrogenase-like flavoprotein
MANFDLDDDGVVVIIGSGAGGGTLAHELTRRGIRVVLLEAGRRESLSSFVQDPGQSFGQLSWLDPRTQSGDWSVAKDFPPLPVWHCKTVGGTTVHWTASSLRLHDWEMKPKTTYGTMAGTSFIDWPVTFAELKPWYEVAERRMGVTRRNGNPGMPASNNFKVLYNGAKAAGYSRVHTNYLAINTRVRDGRAACLQQGFCVQGCKIGAKWSTLYTEIPRAEATGKLDMRTGCQVARIESGDDGRVTGVLYRDDKGAEQRQKARVVCVAGNAIETPRLLLLSASARHPDGLANGAGHVGRHYAHHVMGFVWGVFDKPVSMWRGTPQGGIIEDEAVFKSSRGFAGGYHLELVALDLPTFPMVGLPYGWGRDFTRTIDQFRNVAGILFAGEDVPRADNRITLSGSVKDRWGLPVANVHVDEHENDRAMRQHAQQRGRAVYEAAGAQQVIFGPAPPATHNMGTCRMSASPADGVCNRWGQTHEVRNLFISDGSQFSSSGGANPTLTIVALALRQGEYIARQMMSRAI